MELEAQADELRERGYGIAVISYDPPEVMAAFAREHGISFARIVFLPMASNVRCARCQTSAADATLENAQVPDSPVRG